MKSNLRTVERFLMKRKYWKCNITKFFIFLVKELNGMCGTIENFIDK